VDQVGCSAAHARIIAGDRLKIYQKT
jgi:hypothetical protein